MAPTPALLPGRSHGRRSLVGCSPWGRWELDTTQWLHIQFSLSCLGEGNGNPLQCSCLENPRDGGAQWAAVSGVTQSRTRLKWLSSSSMLILTFFRMWFNLQQQQKGNVILVRMWISLVVKLLLAPPNSRWYFGWWWEELALILFCSCHPFDDAVIRLPLPSSLWPSTILTAACFELKPNIVLLTRKLTHLHLLRWAWPPTSC